MKDNKKLALVGLITGLSAVVLIGTTAMAATTNDDKYSSLVRKLSERFNLQPEQVQKVFDEQKAERKQNRENKLDARLQQLVDSGAITDAQADKIKAKLQELKQTAQGQTKQERMENRQQFKGQLQQWLDDNDINIDLNQVFPNRTGPKHS